MMNDVIAKTPLVVDLDGSLIKTDLLFETFIKAFYRSPWIIFWVPLWLMQGKHKLKQALATRVDLDIDSLPWNQDLIAYLESQADSGRDIILCTGSWYSLAEQVASRFSFFSRVFGSTESGNLTGARKASLLLNEYGDKNFSYVGNESKDLKIWQYSQSAIVVSNGSRLSKHAEKISLLEKVIENRQLSLKAVLKQMRVHQWVKNALVFIPLITSHQTGNFELVIMALLAFFAYSFCASATYILNDLSDLESDRKHDKKRYRPMASGDLSIAQGVLLAFGLFVLSGLFALKLSPLFLSSLGLYVVITLSYSFKLKSLQTLDITVLASLYTLRIISGAFAVNMLPSFWLLGFSMFVFLCLAIIKRVSEIIKNKAKYCNDVKLSGRGYYISDLPVLLNLATASGIISILVFAMYINSPEVTVLYSQPYALWLVCPVFAYWIIRVLIMAARGEIDEDPIVFAIKDWRSWLTGAVILMTLFVATL